MLHDFLQLHRNEILVLCEEKTKKLAGDLGRSEQLTQGLPLFLDQLIRVLNDNPHSMPQKDMLKTAAGLGKEYLALGYSLSHVVHAYGAMCQAITELATIKNANIAPVEFNILNACLDVAIASAVSEYQFRSNEEQNAREVRHLGFLVHELRNALSSATIAHEMIKAGFVGLGGSTAGVLEANLIRMRILIDRSLSEVRMRSDSDPHIEKFRLSDLFDQIVLTSKIDANKRSQTISMSVDSAIEIEADRQFLLSAIANLIQNAIKYSKTGTTIWLRAKLNNNRVVIEIQDECGGIAPEKINSLFKPFVQDSTDRSGLGLGLTIAQRAVELNQGTIQVTNNPGSGCIFIIEMPLKLAPSTANKRTVPGEDSVQPDFQKKK